MLKSAILITAVLLQCHALQGETMSNSTGSPSHPFNVHDLWSMERVSGPQACPDGRWIVFGKSVTDLKANKLRTDLWLINTDGKGLRRLTSHEAGSHSGVFGPAGRWVWFLSSRSGSSQVWKIRIDGGEAQQVTDQPLDVNGFLLSPDGTRLALVMEIFPDTKTPDETKTRLDEIKKRQATGQVYEQLFIRHWDAWKDGRRSHWLVTPAEGGDVVDVMAGLEMDSPTKPFGGVEEATFAPDSRSLVFAARNTGRAEAWSTDVDLFQVPCDGSSPPQCLTPDNRAWTTNPVFSPDGTKLAYLAMRRPGFEADRFRIMLRDWPGAKGTDRALTESWDRSAGGIVWSKDSKTLFTTANNLGQRSLFSVDLATAKVETLVEQGHVASPSVAGDRVVYAMDHLQGPAELYA
ncbi:MAG: TolB family protein, partial [Phycisphaerae bacterium]